MVPPAQQPTAVRSVRHGGESRRSGGARHEDVCPDCHGSGRVGGDPAASVAGADAWSKVSAAA